MSLHTPSEAVLQQLALDIAVIPPRPHHANLLARVNRLGYQFNYAFCQDDWYRPGRVLTADGTVLASSVQTWAHEELSKYQDDMSALLEQHSELMVTRHLGRTHFFVAAYGQHPGDFLQLEVEELQEVLDRKLLNPAYPPTDLPELVDPVHPKRIEAQAVAAPRYRLRRLINVQNALACAGSHVHLNRMLDEWMRSRAATRGNFCDHWVVLLREHVDRYRNPVTSLTLHSRHLRSLKNFVWNEQFSGTDMAAQIHAFDRAAYPAAWYFHFVATQWLPSKLADLLHQDLVAGYCYLPDSEVALLQGWIEKPYAVC